MAATRVLPLRAIAGANGALPAGTTRPIGTARIEFRAETEITLNCSGSEAPSAAFLAGTDPQKPALAMLSARNGAYIGKCTALNDISAIAVCARDGRIIFEANRTLSASGMDAFRRVCRAKRMDAGKPPAVEAHAVRREEQPPSDMSAPMQEKLKEFSQITLPPPQSAALSDILATARQLFPEPGTPMLPPATEKSAGRAPKKGIRRKRTKKSATITEQPPPERPMLSLPFPKEDVFAAGFPASVYTLPKFTPAPPSASPAPVLRGVKIESPFPNTYPDYTFYRVPLPFFRQPLDFCLIGLSENETVYALPVEGEKKRPPPLPLCAGAALRRGTDGVMYATVKI